MTEIRQPTPTAPLKRDTGNLPPPPPPPPPPAPATTPAGAQQPAGDRRVPTAGATPTGDRVQTAISNTGQLNPTANMGDVVARRQAAQQAVRWANDARQALTAVQGNNGDPAALAQTASLLARPDQIQAARDALAPIANTDQGRIAMDQLDTMQATLNANRPNVERALHNNLQRHGGNSSHSLAGIRSEQNRADLQAFAANNPQSKAALDRIAARPPMSTEFNANRLAVQDPAAIGTQARALANKPAERDAMLRQAVQGLADQHFGSVNAGGQPNVPAATAAMEAGMQRLRDAGVDPAALDRAKAAVMNDPSNQVMLQNPGHDAIARLAIRTGIPDAVRGQIDGAMDTLLGPRVENQPSDNVGPFSHVTDRIPPGGSRTIALEGEARLGPVNLGAGASMTVARTQPQGEPPSTRLQVTFSVNASAAVGFERQFGKSTGAGSVTGQAELQARVDGKASFTYEFDTSNPQHMQQLRDLSGALVRTIPGAGTLIAGTEGPGVQQALQGLSDRHVETKLEASVTATARLEATAQLSERTGQLAARYDQARAGLERAQAIGGSMQEAYGALSKSPPDFSAAFTSMQAHLPPGAVKAGQVATDAANAQRLYSEGKTQEAMQILQGYMPPALQNAARVATDASRAYQAMNAGNPAEAFQIMQQHLPQGAQNAVQMAQDAQRAQQLQAEGKTDEAMKLLQGYLPASMQGASQVALDAFRAQQMIRDGNPTEAFNLMNQHLPAGAQRTQQVAADAQKAQQLVAEGKHAEALALLTPYMPAGAQATVGQAQAGLNAYNAIQTAFQNGDLRGGLAAMQQAIGASTGMAQALRQQVTELPGQIAAARAAVQTLREMPAQLRDQIANLPQAAKDQVTGLLNQAAEQVQGLRAQANDLVAQAARLPETARAQAQQLRDQARALTTQAADRAKALTAEARNLPATVRAGVMDRINAATAAPAAVTGPVASVQLTGSVSASVSHTRNHRDQTTTTSFGLTAQGTVAAESSRVGQYGTGGATNAQVSVTRGPDGRITGVQISRSYQGESFAATASRELVGDLDPQVIASVSAQDRVTVTRQVDMNALGITPDMQPHEVAAALATRALSATPPGRVVSATATNTQSVQVRADLVAASIALRLDRTQQRELRTPGT